MGRPNSADRRPSSIAVGNGLARSPVFTTDGIFHYRALCLFPVAEKPYNLSEFDIPSRRLVARNRQHVVLVAGGICARGRLGPTALLARLSGGGGDGLPV